MHLVVVEPVSQAKDCFLAAGEPFQELVQVPVSHLHLDHLIDGRLLLQRLAVDQPVVGVPAQVHVQGADGVDEGPEPVRARERKVELARDLGDVGMAPQLPLQPVLGRDVAAHHLERACRIHHVA